MPSPPIVVGELSDVPAPLSPINANFHQEVANRIVHRFANLAMMNGWPAANGSVAYAMDSGLHYRRVAGAWVPIMTGDPKWLSYSVNSGILLWWNKVGRYMRVGDMCFVSIYVNGFYWMQQPAGVALQFTLPFPNAGGAPSQSGTATIGYTDGVILMAGLVEFANNRATPYPEIGANGQIHPQGFLENYPRGDIPEYSYVKLSGWYPIG